MTTEMQPTEGRLSDPQYAEWRSACWTRDNGICQVCGKPGEEVHHIASCANAPEKRYLVSNGVTLCRDCHSQTASYFNPSNDSITNLQWNRQGRAKAHSTINIFGWMKLHLNMAFVCAILISLAICMLGNLIFTINYSLIPVTLLLFLLGILAFTIMCGWILHQKDRSAANVLLLFSPILGWIIFLFALLGKKQSQSTDNKNWFKRHLNLTFLFVILEFAIFWIAEALTSNINYIALNSGYMRGFAIWTFIIICVPVSGWILNQKGRSTLNLLWLLVPLIGQLVFLYKILADNQQVPASPKENTTEPI